MQITDPNVARVLPPVTLTDATSLTRADHANRQIIANKATSFNLTIQTDALGGYQADDCFEVYNDNTGDVTIVGSGITLHAPTGTTATASQFQVIGAVRVGTDEWTLLGVSATSSSGLTQGKAAALNTNLQ